MKKVKHIVGEQRERVLAGILIFIGENGAASQAEIVKHLGLIGKGATSAGKYLRRLMKTGMLRADENLLYTFTVRGEKVFNKLKQEIPF